MLAHLHYPRSSRGSAFLLAMVALVTLMVLGTSLVEVSIYGLARSSREHKNSVALALAESGVDMALDKLYEDPAAAAALTTTGTYSNSLTLSQGQVDYTATAPYNGIPNTCTIVSTANTTTGKVQTVRIIAHKLTDVSRVFDGVLFSDSALEINGSLHVTPGNTGEGNSIYAKGNIDFNGKSANMEYYEPGTEPPTYDPLNPTGQIYTSGVVTGTDPTLLSGVDPTNIYEHIAPISMPVIDLNYYEENATQIYNGPAKFGTGGISMTGLSGIIFVKGNVAISGSYSGLAMIVATGSITITGNGVTAQTPGTDAVALLTPKSVKINGGAEVDGLVYAHGITTQATASAGGDITIHGALVADVITTNGGITAVYDDVWRALPIPGKEGGQWAKVSWEALHLPAS